MSDLQQPMYGGVRMNAASSTPAPVQTADVSTKPAQRALQNAQEFVSDVAHQYQRMKDFGEQTRLEGQMDTLATEFEQEMTKRLGFARGHELSFYNGDGTLKESSLNTFVRNYEGKLRGLKGTFVAQEEAARFGARQQDVMRRLQGRATELLLKGQIQESRQAFDEGLKGDIARKDYQGATNRRIQAYQAGIISENGMNNGILEDTRNRLLNEYEQDMLTDPSIAFAKLGNGYFDELGAGEVLKKKEATRRFLRSANRTDGEDGAPGYRKGSLWPKASLRYGATEQEYDWVEHYNRTGSYGEYAPSIKSAFREDLRNLPPANSGEDRTRSVNDMLKKWGQYGQVLGDERKLRLFVEDRIDAMGKPNTNRNNIEAVLKAMPDHVYIPYFSYQVANAYKDGDQEKIRKTEDERNEVEADILYKTELSMTEWRQAHPNATLTQDLAQIHKFTAFHSLNRLGYTPVTDEDKKKGEEGIMKKSLEAMPLYSFEQPEQSKASPEKREAQQKKAMQYIKGQKPHMPSPLENHPISFVRHGASGAYVSKQAYEAIKAKFGNKPFARVSLGRGEAFLKVPIVGIYEGNPRGIEVSGPRYERMALRYPGERASGSVRIYDGKDEPEVPEEEYGTGLLPSLPGGDTYTQVNDIGNAALLPLEQ